MVADLLVFFHCLYTAEFRASRFDGRYRERIPTVSSLFHSEAARKQASPLPFREALIVSPDNCIYVPCRMHFLPLPCLAPSHPPRFPSGRILCRIRLEGRGGPSKWTPTKHNNPKHPNKTPQTNQNPQTQKKTTPPPPTPTNKHPTPPKYSPYGYSS